MGSLSNRANVARLDWLQIEGSCANSTKCEGFSSRDSQFMFFGCLLFLWANANDRASKIDLALADTSGLRHKQITHQPIQFVSTELEELRRTVRRLDMENAILRDILASAIEIADIALLMAKEQSKSRQADCDPEIDPVRPFP